MNKLVYAIIVTYNRAEILKTTLSHVLAQTVKPFTTIIVDNNSTDGTKEYLKSLQHHNIHCLFLNSNVGSAGAIAYGMKYGLTLKEPDYFWIMDDDTFYEKNTLRELIDNIQNSEFALLGVQGANIKFGKKVFLKPDIKLQEADYALIDGAIIKTSVIQKIGHVREKFFMMCDDHEYCMRLKKYGLKIGVLRNGTEKRLFLGGQGKFTKATLWRGYYSSRNHMLILKEYFSMISLLGYLITQSKFIIAAALFAPDRVQRVKLRILGIWHGLKGVDGKTLDPATLKFQYDN